MRKPFRIRDIGQASPGFTLIELMVTVAVAALLLGIAAPSFRDMTVRNRVSTYSNDLIASVNYARSEAVRRGAPISICRSGDGTSCSGSWSDGWIVFANTDNDNPADVDAGEMVLKAQQGLAPNYTLGADASFVTSVTYRSDGAANDTGMFAVCHDASTIGGRAVIITPLRPRVARDTDGDRIPNRDDSQNIASCDAPSGP